jgi:hypothetical protein
MRICLFLPFFITYLFGRYQNGELPRAQLEVLFRQFGHFWDGDGQHNVWVRSCDDGRLVYDRHKIIYAYGPLERFESALA